jgi:tetratricopeptide (TPR) repeat protein
MLRLDLAKVLAESGQPAEADREYQAVLKLQPDFAPALTGLGALRLTQGRADEALAYLTKALEINPAGDQARFNLGRALEMRGERAAARAEYQRLLQQPQASAAVRAAARERLSALGR